MPCGSATGTDVPARRRVRFSAPLGAPARSPYGTRAVPGPSMWDILGQRRDHLGVGGRAGPRPELHEAALRLAARVTGRGGGLGDRAAGRERRDQTAVDVVELHTDRGRRRL